MRRTPFGYRIINGRAVVDETEAGQVRTIFEAYLAGQALEAAAAEAGLRLTHSVVGNLLRNPRYVGNAFYPAILSRETFDRAASERLNRAQKLSRVHPPKVKSAENRQPNRFSFKPLVLCFEDPFRQAEYAYSQIECEEKCK